MKWGERGRASVLVGGQFGSEGKGAIAAWLATQADFEVATTNAGAQAGHTTRYRDGRKFVCFHLPTHGVVQRHYSNITSGCLSFINAGSIIDIEALKQELKDCDMSFSDVFIHPNAAVIAPEDKIAERAVGSSTSNISSTQKGVGMAIANKVMRRSKPAHQYEELRGMIANSTFCDLNSRLLAGDAIAVEVPQGTGLSLNHSGFYPYTTSRDCWVGSGLQDAGIHPSFVGPVCMVVRTFPIRVGNLTNENGEQIGTSGEFFPGSIELDWAEHFPGIEPERTTVTKRVRRIATWSNAQYKHALQLNRPSIVALTFCDYLDSAAALLDRIRMMHTCEAALGLNVQRIFAFGPCVEDIITDQDEALAWYEKRGR